MSVMEGGPNDPAPQRMTRRLARVAELMHTVNYYTEEINRFRDDGFRGWWHAYMAYRSAPLGPVDAPVVTAAFYNFAPRMIERAVPGVWEIMAPDQVLVRRTELVAEALDRIYGDGRFDQQLAEAAELTAVAIEDLEVGARPLTAALSALARPEDTALALWQDCTVLREYRGDGHNIALATAGIDGLESHLFMSAAGHGNQPTITGIRGWTEDEWQAAKARLQGRGLLDAEGGFTAEGDRFRAEIEVTTDRLSSQPLENLGMERAERLFTLLVELTDYLRETGEVAGMWPPPATLRS